MNLGPSFEQTVMGWKRQCYIPKFVEIGRLVPEKNILNGFYHIWAWRPSWSCDPDAADNLSTYPWMSRTKFGFDWPIGFKEVVV